MERLSQSIREHCEFVFYTSILMYFQGFNGIICAQQDDDQAVYDLSN